MADTENADATLKKGPVAWMARNPVAANLLMLIIIAAGLIGLLRSKQEVFPEFSLDIVTVSVAYPGASPAEVEQGIVLALEERVRGIDGVKRVTGTAAEGAGAVSIEVLLGADPDRVLADVKSEVDRIQTFPEETERPTVALASRRNAVVTLVISGEATQKTLHDVAERVRADLLAKEGITYVEVEGLPPLEVSVAISRETLQSYSLSLPEVSRQITAAALELPGGGIKTQGGEILVRVTDRALTREDFEDIEIRGTLAGSVVRLGDIATVTDGFADNDQRSAYNGAPAVRITAFRVGQETPTSVAIAVREVAEQLRGELPEAFSIDLWDDNSILLQDRINLLLKNGYLGLVLVFVILALFLDLRLAFWVGLGIPLSFLGAFTLMPGADISINMVTLFAFIITLGMVVDDAIVVGENIYEKTTAGVPPLRASIEGAREMVVPVSFSILTTVAAFAPMLFIPGVMGKIFRLMPAVVIAVLLFSLIESFFILPAHLSHGSSELGRRLPIVGTLLRPFEVVRGWVTWGLAYFTQHIYSRVLKAAVEHRYITLAIGIGVFLVSIGMVASNRVPRQFFPALEGDVVTVSARLPYGAPLQNAESIRRELEGAAERAIAQLGSPDAMTGMLSLVGELPGQFGPGAQNVESGSHLLGVQVQLVPTGERTFSAEMFAGEWRAQTPALVGVEAVSFNSSVGPGAGAAVDAQLSHPDTALLADASDELTKVLATYPTLTNVENGYAAGKPQVDFHLLPQAQTLGLTAQDVALQLRAAFFGSEALREQRGRNEVRVMVRLPETQRRSEHDLEELMVKTPAGGFVSLSSVAAFDRGRAATVISREGGQRVVNVKASRAAGVSSSNEVIASLREEVFPGLLAKYEGLSIELVGEQREQSEAFSALGWNFAVAILAIYALIAIPFRSYFQPLIVMSAIPFGVVGAILGHWLMGYELSFVSGMGMVALAGVVINDSLVLIDTTNRKRREGATAYESIIYGGSRRLRPILLTSLTTFFGLAPMIVETSVQARFLIPMAISLGFGVLFATFIILLIVPALYMILEDAYWAWSLDPLAETPPVEPGQGEGPPGLPVAGK